MSAGTSRRILCMQALMRWMTRGPQARLELHELQKCQAKMEALERQAEMARQTNSK